MKAPLSPETVQAGPVEAAGRTARRVNVPDSLMVRPETAGPTASVTVRQHGRQLPLLLELFHNQSHNQVQMDMCDLLLADRGRDGSW